MTCPHKRVLIASSMLIALFVLSSCGPSGPRPGTPAFAWGAARKAFASGDVNGTVTQLADVVKTENEFTARAQTWSLVVSAGQAEGYISLADAFQAGGKASGDQVPVAFRRKLADYRSIAASRSLEFGQALMNWQKSHAEQSVIVDCPFPPASLADLPEVAKIKNGGMLPDASLPALETRVIQQSVAKALAAAVGAPGDAAKAQGILQAGNVQVPRDTFYLAMANNLYDVAQLFSRSALNNTDRLEWMGNKAAELLKSVQETNDSKDLSLKLELMLRDAKR